MDTELAQDTEGRPIMASQREIVIFGYWAIEIKIK